LTSSPTRHSIAPERPSPDSEQPERTMTELRWRKRGPCWATRRAPLGGGSLQGGIPRSGGRKCSPFSGIPGFPPQTSWIDRPIRKPWVTMRLGARRADPDRPRPSGPVGGPGWSWSSGTIRERERGRDIECISRRRSDQRLRRHGIDPSFSFGAVPYHVIRRAATGFGRSGPASGLLPQGNSSSSERMTMRSDCSRTGSPT
jgi:hypothetical protein